MSNLQFQNATFAQRKMLGKIQTAENIRISVKNDIVEVLSVGIDHIINSYDATEGEVTFYGKTGIKFLYNDGNGIVGSGFNADFTAGFSCAEITAGSKMCFEVVTVDSKVETNANTATLTLLLEITAYGYTSQSIAYFAEGDDVFVKKQSIEVPESADILLLPTVIDEEKTASCTIDTVLLAESALVVDDCTNADGILHISGEAVARLTYLSDGLLKTDTLPFAFERELDAADIPQDARLKITPQIRSTKVRLNIAEDSANTDFTVEISAVMCVEVVKTTVVDIATDAYGTDCDFDFERQWAVATLPCGHAICKKQNTSILPSENKNVLSAVDVGALVTKCVSQEGCAKIEGVICATAIFATDDGMESQRLELPFVQTVDVEGLSPQCEACANVTVTDFSLAEEGGLKATAELCFAVDGYKNVRHNLIVAAEEKPFDKTKLSAIEVCLAHKGESLWELAKSLHLSEEDLLAVNPEISNPLSRDARIVVYNKI